MMKTVFLILTFYGWSSNSSQKEYGCNDLTYKNGYTYEIESGDLANGRLECDEYVGATYTSYIQYANGIKVEWVQLVDGEIIEQGKTIINSKLVDLLSQKIKAKKTGLRVYQIRDATPVNQVNFDVYEPEEVLDSIQIRHIVYTYLRGFMIDNQANQVDVYTLKKDGFWTDKQSYRLKE